MVKEKYHHFSTGIKQKSQQIQKRYAVGCSRSRDRKIKYTCYECDRFICIKHLVPVCEKCDTKDSSSKMTKKCFYFLLICL